jgi:hypothetical protein
MKDVDLKEDDLSVVVEKVRCSIKLVVLSMLPITPNNLE